VTAQRFFRTSEGALRAPWRVVVFLVACGVCVVAASAIVMPLVGLILPLLDLGPLRSTEWSLLPALVVAHAISLRVDGGSWRDVGLHAEAARPRLLAGGFGIGLVAILVPTVGLIAVGWLDREPGSAGGIVPAAVRATLVLVPAAFNEELIARGYLFAVARRAGGPVVALATTSIFFGLLHIANPGASAMSVTVVALAGVFLGAVFLATNSLYAAWLAHFAWNFGMAVLFHVPVSGLPMEMPAYRFVDAGPDWATGGAWGPEAGVPAVISMLVGIGILWYRGKRRRATGTVSSSGRELPVSWRRPVVS
jgi:membrane protease YdiL (CAAX protease family)